MTREALARHPVAIVGALLTTVSAVLFIALVIAGLAGLFDNPYAGLLIFVAIPAVFVLGLLLIPLGMWLQRRKLARDPTASVEWPVVDFRLPRVRRTALVVAALTAVNAVIVLVAGYGSLHWMESPTFCGQACHIPMQPQYTAWQDAPHARVACATCHIGEGPSGFVHAKLSGVRQLVHVATNSFPRPIPPGTNMPAGAQARTCIGCHQPDRAVGDRVRVIREYADDEGNSETTTVLQMHVGASTSSQRAIHWHANPAIRVEYIATDAQRQTIPYVKVTNASGEVKEFVAADTADDVIRAGQRRTMDCVDCHNTVGHPIAPTPEQAVDREIAAARVSRELPFARREALRLLKEEYPSQDAGLRAIDEEFRKFYASRGGTDPQAVARSAAALQDVYRRNVFPSMKVTWGAYPDNRGHITSTGCFRCHDDSHMAKDGSTISAECELCHKMVDAPF
ncbi:MAG TPA: NapC/NirT family cytochrome c [Vicinamibacterales bacterium]|nr:NapC/NirT family cytochrome c [Vicinamibacterales bacterium]